jgi:hypothetical protein
MGILDHHEILTVQSKINALPNGIYEVSEIFGEDWEKISDPHGYGRRFLQTVIKNLLHGIKYHDRKLDNHRTYSICR